jgi:transposase
MEWSVFLPLLQGLRMTEVCQGEASLLIQVISERVSAYCPLCGQSSDAVHSRYRRQLKDVPCGGQAVCRQLTVHTFFCRNPQCPRKIFTERIPQFVKPWAQTTVRFTQALQAIGFATSGRLGARLATRLGIATSWMTILRRMMALPTPAAGSVIVLGIDDFSFKRGRKFGTILVDLVGHTVIDLLAERSSQSAADWMRKYPEIAYVSRDRGKDYARGSACWVNRGLLQWAGGRLCEQVQVDQMDGVRQGQFSVAPSTSPPCFVKRVFLDTLRGLLILNKYPER